jgi:SAM-dependent methyltransferase
MSSENAGWKAGLADELAHWRRWLAEGSTAFVGQFDDYAWRTSPDSLLQAHHTRHLERHAPPGRIVHILDVGAGPLTAVGKQWPGRFVEITAVDALAESYDAVLAEAGLVPLVRTTYAEAERLTERFAPDSYDLVYCQNALDHVYDPLQSIREMLAVVKRGHAVVLLHTINEAEHQGYGGLHQWNLCADGKEFVLWNREQRISVAQVLASVAEVTIEPCWEETLLLVALTKRTTSVPDHAPDSKLGLQRRPPALVLPRASAAPDPAATIRRLRDQLLRTEQERDELARHLAEAQRENTALRAKVQADG